MGPRLFSRGDTVALVAAVLAKLRLQWGRGCSAAEMCRRVGPTISFFTRFNGAAAVQPLRLWTNRPPVPRFCGFNGAAAVQPRRCEAQGKRTRSQRPASMGPRLFSRGDERRYLTDISLGKLLQWGRGCSAAEMCTTCSGSRWKNSGFNGAAAVQPRRYYAPNSLVFKDPSGHFRVPTRRAVCAALYDSADAGNAVFILHFRCASGCSPSAIMSPLADALIRSLSLHTAVPIIAFQIRDSRAARR